MAKAIWRNRFLKFGTGKSAGFSLSARRYDGA